MVNLDKGYETIIFAWQGKTMIGKVVIDKTMLDSDTATGTVFGKLITNKTDYFIIHNPCEIEFDIETPAQGSAELNWLLKPYYYKYLIADDGVSYAPFAFHKNEVVLSNIGGTTIHPDILAAYKELVGV